MILWGRGYVYYTDIKLEGLGLGEIETRLGDTFAVTTTTTTTVVVLVDVVDCIKKKVKSKK